MQEELEVEKKRKTEELEELGKAMEKEYEDRVRKALAQLRWHPGPPTPPGRSMTTSSSRRQETSTGCLRKR